MEGKNRETSWAGYLFQTVIPMGVVTGSVAGYLATQSYWWALIGTVILTAAGLFVFIVTAAAGGMEFANTFRGYLLGVLGFALLYLAIILAYAGRYAFAATVCIVPLILLFVFESLADRRKKSQDRPKLNSYYKQMNSIVGEPRTADSYTGTRARKLTLQVLPDLGPQGKGQVILYLYEMKLITAGKTPIDLSGADLRNIDLSYGKLNQICLNSADLSKANLRSADLCGTSFHKSVLNRAILHSADLSKANFSEASLVEAKFISTDLTGANLSQSDLRNAILQQAVLLGADLSGANCGDCHIRMADLNGADLRSTNFAGADLSSADLSGTDIRSTNFAGANLKRVKLHDAVLEDDTNLDDKWRMVWDIQSHNKPGRKLRYTDLSDTDLSKVNLSSSDLSCVNFSEAYLREADLRHSDLMGANFHKAILGDADLRHSDARGVNFREANLRKADLR